LVILTRGWGNGWDGLLRATVTGVAVGLLAPAVPYGAAVPCAGAGRAAGDPALHPAIAQTLASALAASSVRLMMVTSMHCPLRRCGLEPTAGRPAPGSCGYFRGYPRG
jgi:hypothetical protein